MKSFMKIIIIGLVVIWLVTALLIFKDNKGNKEKPTVRIATIQPITGGMSNYGEANAISFEILNDYLKTQNLKYNYEFIIEDNEDNQEKTRAIVKKLKDEKDVDIIHSAISDTAKIINSELGNNDVINMSMAADPEISNARDYSWQYDSHPKDYTMVMAEQLVTDNINEVNILIERASYFFSFEPFIKRDFAAKGIKYNIFVFNPGDTDFIPMLEKTEANTAQANILLSYSPEAEIIAEQLQEIESNKLLTSMATFFLAQDKDAFEGEWFIAPNAIEDDYFKQEFTRRSNSKNTYLAQANYDIFLYIVSLIETLDPKGDGLDREELNKLLYGTNLLPLSTGGRNWTLEGRYIHIPTSMAIIEEGKMIYLEE